MAGALHGCRCRVIDDAAMDPMRCNAHSVAQAQQFGGVLAIAGALDGAQKPVLLASHNEDHMVRLWELPTFAERGELSAVSTPLIPCFFLPCLLH